MTYLTYDQYRDYGGKLPETEFNQVEFACRKRIDAVTFGRVARLAQADKLPEAVLRCMFALVGLESRVGANAQVETPVVTSFTTDGYSEHYGNAMTAKEAEAAMNSIIRMYLADEVDLCGYPLLYRGVYR